MSPSRRLISLFAALIVTAGLGACGDSDGTADGGSGGSRDSTSGTDERQIRNTVDGLYEDLGNYDAAGVCSRMSPSARRQIARGAIGAKASGSGGCAKAFGRFLDTAKRQGGLEKTLTAEIDEVEVDGIDARVTVSFGQQSGQIPLRKVDGEWKVGIGIATPSADDGGR